MNQQQTQNRMQQLASEASALFDQADAEGRQLTLEERAVAEDNGRRFKDLQSKQQVLDVAERIGVLRRRGRHWRRRQTAGPL
jgi:hypothetical protein